MSEPPWVSAPRDTPTAASAVGSFAFNGPQALADAFATISHQLSTQPDTRSALQALTDLTVQLVPGATCSSVTRRISNGFTTMAFSDPIAKRTDELQFQLRSGPCIDAVSGGVIVESADLDAKIRWSTFGEDAARDLGVRAVLSARIVMDDDQTPDVGLNMYADQAGVFTDDSRRIATLLATHAAVAVAAVGYREDSRNLREALSTSREIGVAMGILMATVKLTRDQAIDLLRIASQNTNRKIRDLATEVADTGTLDPSTLNRPQRPADRHRTTLRSTTARTQLDVHF